MIIMEFMEFPRKSKKNMMETQRHQRSGLYMIIKESMEFPRKSKKSMVETQRHQTIRAVCNFDSRELGPPNPVRSFTWVLTSPEAETASGREVAGSVAKAHIKSTLSFNKSEIRSTQGPTLGGSPHADLFARLSFLVFFYESFCWKHKRTL